MPTTHEIVDRYYAAANAGDWQTWLSLFSDDLVMDEQLAGHIEGIDTLRGVIDGIDRAFPRFQNVPRHVVVDGDEAVVVSHISAETADGRAIEVGVSNYFRIRDGRIAYMANFHDSVPFTGSPMSTREVIDTYYRSANAGDWQTWLTLFKDDVVMDEQLAGHVEGIDVLRGAIGVMEKGYSRFQNVPKHVVVDGDQAAVVSHISAANAAGEPIEAEVCNYFRVEDGKIAYMANFHDTVPFKPFTSQDLS